MDIGSDDTALRKVARRLLRDRHLAEDTAQDVWLAALGREADLRERTGFLLGTLRHVAIDALRTSGRRRRRETLCARPDVAPSVYESVQSERVRHALSHALESLPPEYERVLRMRFYDDLPPRSIARALGLQVETVRTRIKRGLARMRRQLERDSGDVREWRLALLAFAEGSIPAAASSVPARESTLRAARGSTSLRIGLGSAVVLGFVSLAGFLGQESRSAAEPPLLASGRETDRGVEPKGAPASDGATPGRSPALVPWLVRVVVDENSRPVAGSTVSLAGELGGSSIATDRDGVATFHVPAGSAARVEAGATATTWPGSSTLLADETSTAAREVVLRVASKRALSGVVVDALGRPVPGARVRGVGADVETRTDAEGCFVLHGLSDSFRVQASEGDRASTYDLKGEEVPAGTYSGFELVLVRTTPFGGSVHGPSGRLSGAEVRAEPECGASRRTGYDAIHYSCFTPSAVTGPDGRFEFERLTDQRWRFVASSDELLSDQIVTRPGSRPGVRFDLLQGVSVSVHVLDPGGAPLGDALVEVWSAPPSTEAALSRLGRPRACEALRTDPDGRCSFGGRRAGETLRVAVTAPGLAVSVIDPVDAPSHLAVQLVERRRLAGRVVDPMGRPQADVRVVLRRDEDMSSPEERLVGAGKAALATTDENGVFTIEDAPEGRLSLFAEHGSEDSGRFALVHLPGVANDGRPLEIVLGGAQRVFSGRVTDLASDDPLAGASISAYSAELGHVALLRSGAEGDYELRIPYADDWTFVFTAAGRAVETRLADDFSDGPLDVALGAPRAVELTLVDANGVGVECAYLRVEDPAGRPVVIPAANGRFGNGLGVGALGRIRLEGLPPRAVRVSVTVPHFSTPEVFELAPETARQTLILDRLVLSAPMRDLELVLLEPSGELFVGSVEIDALDLQGRVRSTLAGRWDGRSLQADPLGEVLGYSLSGRGKPIRFGRDPLASGDSAYGAEASFRPPGGSGIRVPHHGGTLLVRSGSRAASVRFGPAPEDSVRTLVLPEAPGQ